MTFNPELGLDEVIGNTQNFPLSNEIEIELNEKGLASSKALAIKPSNDRPGKSLTGLVPKADILWSLNSRKSNAKTAAELKAQDKELGLAQWGSGLTDLTELESLATFDKIYQRISQGLGYPSLFISEDVSGTVKSRLYISPDGKCNWERTRISSVSQPLKVYVLSVLKTFCKYNKNQLAQDHFKNDFYLDMSMDFAMGENEKAIDIEKKNFVSGNALFFYLHSQKSAFDWNIGPLRGFLLLPSVKMNLGEYEGFAYIMQKFDEITSGKISRRPIDEGPNINDLRVLEGDI